MKMRQIEVMFSKRNGMVKFIFEGIRVKLATDYRCQSNISQSQVPSTFQDNLLVSELCQAVKYLGFEAVQKKKTLNAQALKLVQCLRELIVSSDEIQHGDLIKSTLSRPLFIAAESGILFTLKFGKQPLV
ncbi:hypothetical protein GmHk_15G043834 [Glycine max]|nr:hypothetical protein GmHk_15G043834 [Glycine max]